MKKDFKLKCKRKYKKDKLDKAFYNYFFKNIVKKNNNLTIESFEFPKNSKSTRKLNCSSKMHKTINSDYVSKLKMSNEFMQKFKGYFRI